MSSEFDSAHDLLAWSAEDAAKFHELAQAFLDGDCYSRLKESDPQTGHIYLKVRFAPVPSELLKLASHVIWDLKHSLDHATCAAIRVVTGQEAGDVHFPIANGPADLEQRLAGTFTSGPRKGQPKFPPALRPIFKKFEPYPTGSAHNGGGDEFVAFSRLANHTKHAISLDVGAAAQVAGAKGTGGLKRLWVDNWNAAARELTVCEIDPSGHPTDIQFTVAASIRFSGVEAFKGAHAWDVLSALGQGIEGIVNELEAEASRLAP